MHCNVEGESVIEEYLAGDGGRFHHQRELLADSVLDGGGE